VCRLPVLRLVGWRELALLGSIPSSRAPLKKLISILSKSRVGCLWLGVVSIWAITLGHQHNLREGGARFFSCTKFLSKQTFTAIWD